MEDKSRLPTRLKLQHSYFCARTSENVLRPRFYLLRRDDIILRTYLQSWRTLQKSFKINTCAPAFAPLTLSGRDTQKDTKTSFTTNMYQVFNKFRLLPVACAASELVSEYDDKAMDVVLYQRIEKDLPEVSAQEIDEYIARETPEQRVHDFFFRKIDYQPHPKWRTLYIQVVGVALVSFLGGGYSGRSEARAKFIEKHKTEQFINRYHAASKLSKIGWQAYIRKGLLYCFKTSIFLSMLVGVPTVLTVYNNKNSLSDWVLGGVLAGFFTRGHLGPRAMVSGMVLGSGFGLSYGLVCTAPIYFGLLPSQEEAHRRYIWLLLSVEKMFDPADEFKQQREERELSFDEEGLLPLSERGRRWRKNVRTFLGLAKTEENKGEEEQAWLENDSDWNKNKTGPSFDNEQNEFETGSKS